MRKYFSILALGIVAMLTSCQKEDVGTANNPETVTINVAVDDAVSTRAATDVTRYLMQMYTDNTYTTTYDDQQESTDGTFTLTLESDTEYYCLLWADVAGGETTYDTDDLTAVALKANQNPVEAWAGKLHIPTGVNANLSVSLTRAVAKINLMETGVILPNSSLEMEFNHPTIFDISSEEASGAVSRTETFILANNIDGSTTNVTLNSDPIYVLANSTTTETVLDKVTFTMSSTSEGAPTEAAFDVPNVPLKANRATNIVGHYTSLEAGTFTVTATDAWDEYEHFEPTEPVAYKIGDTYPYGATGDQILGVVFSVSNGGKNGKIVSLDEETNKTWDEAKAWANDYAVGGKDWYCPPKDELKELFAGMSGLQLIAGSGGTIDGNTITDWGDQKFMTSHDDSKYVANRADFNKTITDAAGTKISEYYYWSSTEKSDDGAWRAVFDDGTTGLTYKSTGIYVRAVLAF